MPSRPAVLAALTLLLVSTCPLLAQPFPSFMLDSTAVVQPDAEAAGATSIAFGTDVGLVAWCNGMHVKACRVSSDLVPLDSVCLHLTGAISEFITEVDVASCGDSFLVVWPGDGDQGSTIVGAIVSASGASGRPVTIDSSNMGHQSPRVAFDGTNYIVAWEAYLGENFGVYSTRVAPDGTVLDRPARRVAIQPETQFLPDVAWGDTSYLVVWVSTDSGAEGIYCNLVKRNGWRVGNTGFMVTEDSQASSPKVVFDGTHFVVEWRCYGESASACRGARVDQSGVVIDTGGVLLVTASIQSSGYSLATVGGTRLLAWAERLTDTWKAYAVRLDSSLGVLDSSPLVLSKPYTGFAGAPGGMSVTARDTDFTATWSQFMGVEPYIYSTSVVGRRVSTGGLLPESVEVLLSFAASTQRDGDIATDGQDFLAVWMEYRSDFTLFDRDLFRMRFGDEGRLLDTAPVLLARDAHAPKVAYGDGCYLVAWSGNPNLTAARITSAGVLIDTTPIVMPYPGPPDDIVFADSLFLVVWHDAGQMNVLGSRVTRGGRVLDSVPLLLQPDPSKSCRDPRVASDGDKLIVVARTLDTRYPSLVRCTPDGALLDTAELVLGRFEGGVRRRVNLARGDSGFLAAATWNVSSVNTAWLLDTHGLPADTVVGLFPAEKNAPVAFDGVNYVLLYNGPGGVYVQRVSQCGVVIDNQPILLVEFDSLQMTCGGWPCEAATNAEGTTGVLFSVYEAHGYCARRLRAATIPLLGVSDRRPTELRRLVSVYPSPFVDRLVIELARGVSGSMRVELFDAAGSFVRSLANVPHAPVQDRVVADLSDLPAGVYFVRLPPSLEHSKVVKARAGRWLRR